MGSLKYLVKTMVLLALFLLGSCSVPEKKDPYEIPEEDSYTISEDGYYENQVFEEQDDGFSPATELEKREKDKWYHEENFNR